MQAILASAAAPRAAICCSPRPASSAACGWNCAWRATEPEFLAESVTFADPDHRWERSFEQVKENAATTMFVMPRRIGRQRRKASACTTAAIAGCSTARCRMGLQADLFVTLWNGEPGDGPGGTQHMVELVRKLTGRRPEIIDPARL